MSKPEADRSPICERVARRRAEVVAQGVGRQRRAPPKAYLSGEVFSDLVACGTEALYRHVERLLEGVSLRTIHVDKHVTRIRVLGALDYVVDSWNRQVYVVPSPFSGVERRSRIHAPWLHSAPSPLHDIDVLKPLCKPACLAYVADRPAWFEFAPAGTNTGQAGLFLSATDSQSALQTVTERCYWRVCDTSAFRQLQADLINSLQAAIGSALMDTAILARPFTGYRGLNAQLLNRVWQSREEFDQVRFENPQLLPALAAWCGHRKCYSASPASVIAAMRGQLLAEGLGPQAWRYLARHGTRKLLPKHARILAWSELKRRLVALSTAGSPHVPRSMLDLLFQVAGEQSAAGWSERTAPPWFWTMLLRHAAHVKQDPCAYPALLEGATRWAYWARRFGLMPDANQLRSGVPWLAQWCAKQESIHALDASQRWLAWLPHTPLISASRFDAVPLRSAADVFKEACALHNCADVLIEDCAAESSILVSLRDVSTGKRRALSLYERVLDSWVRTEVKGPCNEAPTQAIQAAALGVEKALNEWACKIPALSLNPHDQTR